jgi:outer membrane lipopolysaccharide assembly protein LptE/RlpB
MKKEEENITKENVSLKSINEKLENKIIEDSKLQEEMYDTFREQLIQEIERIEHDHLEKKKILSDDV